ncbi:MAG: ATP-dependent protease ATPase subunit HslU [Thermovirgaceae bacterium]|nr:ATP-dependent protease ATPase subunit HslU [Thermovirgaceae bacterium]
MTDPRDEALTPKAIVAYLDRYIVGQDKAKRAVAIALRNRIRRRRLPEEMAREIAPKNILMVGPTGVGKTEIARRLSQLVHAPFIKVEATKFTEVGYVGRDVESMIRDLVERSVQMVKQRRIEEVREEAVSRAKERILDALIPPRKVQEKVSDFMHLFSGQPPKQEAVPTEEDERAERQRLSTRERLRQMLDDGKLEGREIEIEISESAQVGIPVMGAPGMEEMGINLGEMLSGIFPKKKKRKTVTVEVARKMLEAEEAEKLVDHDAAAQEALEKAQQDGIVFIDELDKVASAGSGHSGPDVSREGVQRDLLPIVEGCTVNTRYGPVRTDHILFIAAGAFHKMKPSDLVPELQGRLPLRVELNPLSEEDLARILVEPEHSLLDQYKALLSTEDVVLTFTDEAISEIASLAARMNRETEDIGARRLHTMMENLLEDIQFDASELSGQEANVDGPLVRQRLERLVADTDVRKYLL